jgi:hypothetical protein
VSGPTPTKRPSVEAALLEHTGWSDRRIGASLGCSGIYVSKIRRGMEARGEIERPTHRDCLGRGWGPHGARSWCDKARWEEWRREREERRDRGEPLTPEEQAARDKLEAIHRGLGLAPPPPAERTVILPANIEKMADMLIKEQSPEVVGHIVYQLLKRLVESAAPEYVEYLFGYLVALRTPKDGCSQLGTG